MMLLLLYSYSFSSDYAFLGGVYHVRTLEIARAVHFCLPLDTKSPAKMKSGFLMILFCVVALGMFPRKLKWQT